MPFTGSLSVGAFLGGMVSKSVFVEGQRGNRRSGYEILEKSFKKLCSKRELRNGLVARELGVKRRLVFHRS